MKKSSNFLVIVSLLGLSGCNILDNKGMDSKNIEPAEDISMEQYSLDEIRNHYVNANDDQLINNLHLFEEAKAFLSTKPTSFYSQELLENSNNRPTYLLASGAEPDIDQILAINELFPELNPNHILVNLDAINTLFNNLDVLETYLEVKDKVSDGAVAKISAMDHVETCVDKVAPIAVEMGIPVSLVEWVCTPVGETSAEATQYAADAFGDHLMGKGNAMKHALWNGLMVDRFRKYLPLSIATDATLFISTQHEILGNNPAVDSQIDLHNNQVGVDVFASMIRTEVQTVTKYRFIFLGFTFGFKMVPYYETTEVTVYPASDELASELEQQAHEAVECTDMECVLSLDPATLVYN